MNTQSKEVRGRVVAIIVKSGRIGTELWSSRYLVLGTAYEAHIRALDVLNRDDPFESRVCAAVVMTQQNDKVVCWGRDDHNAPAGFGDTVYVAECESCGASLLSGFSGECDKICRCCWEAL